MNSEALAFLESLRDVAVILLAAMQFTAVAALLLLAWQLWKLVGVLRVRLNGLSESSHEVLASAKEAADHAASGARSVRGGAEFLTDTVVGPVIGVAAAAVGAARFLELLVRPRKSAESRRSNNGEST